MNNSHGNLEYIYIKRNINIKTVQSQQSYIGQPGLHKQVSKCCQKKWNNLADNRTNKSCLPRPSWQPRFSPLFRSWFNIPTDQHVMSQKSPETSLELCQCNAMK